MYIYDSMIPQFYDLEPKGSLINDFRSWRCVRDIKKTVHYNNLLHEIFNTHPKPNHSECPFWVLASLFSLFVQACFCLGGVGFFFFFFALFVFALSAQKLQF